MALCLLSSHVQTAAQRGLARFNSQRQETIPPTCSHRSDSRRRRFRSLVPVPHLNLLMFPTDINRLLSIVVLRVIKQSSPLKQESQVKHIQEQACLNVRVALVLQMAKCRTPIMLKVIRRPQFRHLRHHHKVRSSKAMETFSKVWEEANVVASLHL